MARGGSEAAARPREAIGGKQNTSFLGLALLGSMWIVPFGAKNIFGCFALIQPYTYEATKASQGQEQRRHHTDIIYVCIYIHTNIYAYIHVYIHVLVLKIRVEPARFGNGAPNGALHQSQRIAKMFGIPKKIFIFIFG